ncbi:MAG: 50S ribosomal protein L29 [Gammaproteobacteria bacterium]|nr:50S ribosomal protein L29 [Gammaproteobacteria bacterium]
MDAAEMRQQEPAALKAALLELYREQFNLRMQRGGGQLANPARFKVIRREIARIKTVLNEQAEVAE